MKVEWRVAASTAKKCREAKTGAAGLPVTDYRSGRSCCHRGVCVCVCVCVCVSWRASHVSASSPAAFLRAHGQKPTAVQCLVPGHPHHSNFISAQ